MPILNYTTTVEASKSISEITDCLVKHGARGVMNDYDGEGYITAMSFKIPINGVDYGFRLPSDWRPILVLLEQGTNEYKGTGYRRVRKVPLNMVTQQQALRIAWRILKDWVEAQMALVEIRMVKVEQVFLPYIIMPDNKTLYEKFATSPRFLLGDGSDKQS